MSERCEVCERALSGSGDSEDGKRCGWAHARECYRLGYEREKARADELELVSIKAYAACDDAVARGDRAEAEFCACKALLMAAQQRAEKAEAERAAAEGRVAAAEDGNARMAKQLIAAIDARDVADKRASEARELLRRIRGWDHMEGAGDGPYWKREIDRALAALPVEPARREIPPPGAEGKNPTTCRHAWERHLWEPTKDYCPYCFSTRPVEPARAARDAKEAAPLSNLPPSPTGDAE